jgi:polyisoprenoid-binding protein YceI
VRTKGSLSAKTAKLMVFEITMPVSYLGTAKDPWGNVRAGFEANVTLNRKEFGLTWNAALETGGFLVGDEVRIQLSIQAIVQ